MSMEKDTRETTLNGFDGGMDGERAQNARGTAARLLKTLMRQKWKLLVIFLSVVIGSLFNILAPKVTGVAVNQIFSGVQNALANGGKFQVNWETMGMVLLQLAGLYVLTSAFSYIQQNTMAGVSQTLTLTLRREISEKLNRLPLRYFDRHKKGEVLSRATSDLEKVADTLQDSLSQLLTAFVSIVGSFIMMLVISPTLTLVALVAIAVSLVVAGLVSRRTQRRFAANQEALGRLNAGIEEAFSGNIVIKAFNLEPQTVENTKKLSEELFQAGKKAMFSNYVISPIIRLINQFGYVAIAIGGAMSVIRGRISIGDIQAFIQYVNQVSEPVTQISFTVNTLQGAVAAAERVFRLLDEEEEAPDPAQPQFLTAPRGEVRFENVRFGYSDDAILMQNVSFTARAGDKIAIVGPTGAGKTTLVNLLMRFYELQGGRITIDGPRAPALPDGHGLAGYLAVRRHHPRQHRLWQGRRHGRTDLRGGKGGARRPLHPHHAAGIRYGAQRRNRQPLPRAAAVAYHRPRHPRRPRHPHSRRGHLQRGHAHGVGNPESHGRADAGPHQLYHRPPPFHHPRRQLHPGDEGRCHHRAGQSRGIDEAGQILRRPLQQPVRRQGGLNGIQKARAGSRTGRPAPRLFPRALRRQRAAQLVQRRGRVAYLHIGLRFQDDPVVIPREQLGKGF